MNNVHWTSSLSSLRGHIIRRIHLSSFSGSQMSSERGQWSERLFWANPQITCHLFASLASLSCPSPSGVWTLERTRKIRSVCINPDWSWRHPSEHWQISIHYVQQWWGTLVGEKKECVCEADLRSGRATHADDLQSCILRTKQQKILRTMRYSILYFVMKRILYLYIQYWILYFVMKRIRSRL